MSKTIICNDEEYITETIVVPEDYMEYFDFVDFGAKYGAMGKYAFDSFGANNGLHFELNPDCIKVMEENEIPCIQADVSNLVLPEKCVDFVIATHTIEHLPSIEHIKKMLQTAKSASKDFIYITWPSFDSEEYLRSNGFLKFYSTDDFSGHTCHITSKELKQILNELGLEYEFRAWYRLDSSNHESIVWLDESTDRVDINFEMPIYHENVCLIKIQDSFMYRRALSFLNQFGWDKIL